MTSPSETTRPRIDPLTRALAEYETALEEGGTVDREAFLDRHRDLAGQLAPLLDAAEQAVLNRRARHSPAGHRAPAPRPELEGFELIEEIGRGGMGIVYKARQKGTEQLVALKMLRPDWGGTAAVEQFRLEARAAARLRHPNRVRILLLGEHQGRPFYVMELVEGGSLARKLAGGSVSKAAAVKYVLSLAEALHEAHEHGILHRDVKPANVLIDERTGEALLTDFGLARMGSSEESDHGEGRFAGTLPYASPEQTVNPDVVTAASDVYSLGATLYELLTGTAPFRPRPGETREQLKQRVRTEKPVPPRRRNPGVSRGIERICLKCLAKDPRDRYGSAKELAEALRGYLQEVGYARLFTNMGTLLMLLGPVIALINVAAYWLIRWFEAAPSAWGEAAVWAVVFSMYPALYSVFALAPPAEPGREHYLSRLELWAVWGGKLFAAVSIAVALRVAFASEPVTAMRLAYVVFAALSGMAVFCQFSKMSRVLSLLPLGSWLVGVAMVFRLDLAPLMYGGYCLLGLCLFGLYLRRLGRELA